MFNPDLMMIVPSWGRPDQARRLAEAFQNTCTGKTELMIVAQAEDPHWDQYIAHAVPFDEGYVRIAPQGVGGHGFVRPVNWGANQVTKSHWPARYIGFMGDDHLPMTKGWDTRFISTLARLKAEHGAGYVFGDDQIQGPNFSTHIAMTSNIVKAFGYMANPIVEHLYADNMWTDLGREAGCIEYLPDVIIKHMHYSVPGTTVPEDDTYRIGNSAERWATDPARYHTWRSGLEKADDLWKLRQIMKGEK